VRIIKETFHPRACLSKTKNIKLGLKARTKVLNVLEKHFGDAKSIAIEAEMHYGVVMHHLKLLTGEDIVERKGSKPHIWALTGLGQRRLVNSG